MNELLKGPFSVLMTPFVGDKVDKENYLKQIERLNPTNISGYVTNGSTGEFIQLSLDEQMQISEWTASAKASDKKLIVSACTGNLADTVKLCRHAGKIGADAVLVCPPYYFKYTTRELEEYYTNVADLSPVPVFLYNIPFFTQELELSLAYRLLEHKNVIGIKDSSANMKRLEHMVQKTIDLPVNIFTGTDDILFPALVGGCVGSMTALATIYPNEICGIYDAVKNGNYEKAKEIQFAILPALREADQETFPKGYKKLMERVSGIPFGNKEVLQ